MNSLEGVTLEQYPRTKLCFEREFLPGIRNVRVHLEGNTPKEVVSGEIAKCREVYLRILTMPFVELGGNAGYAKRMLSTSVDHGMAPSLQKLLGDMSRAFETAYDEQLPGSRSRALRRWDMAVEGLLEKLQEIVRAK